MSQLCQFAAYGRICTIYNSKNCIIAAILAAYVLISDLWSQIQSLVAKGDFFAILCIANSITSRQRRQNEDKFRIWKIRNRTYAAIVDGWSNLFSST